MSRNGSGVYSLPAGNPVVTGTTISSSWANTTLSDIATALTGSVAADGQTAMTGNLQMGNNKITGLAVATASGDALSYGQAATISALTVSGAFAANGGATLGDASGDALTINSSAVSIPNGLNFDSNTFVIDATNNRVGVGTASPTSKLQVIDSGTGANTVLVQSGQTGTTPRANTVLRLQTTATGRDVNIQFSDNVTNAAEIGMVGGAQYFSTAGSERMRIDSSGNVGIGTSSPTARLTVDGSVRIFGTTTSGYRLYVNPSTLVTDVYADGTNTIINTVSNGTLNFGTNNTERMRIDSSGNLLVGQTTDTLGSSNSFQITSTGEVSGFNRNNATDGTIMRFKKQGSTVGFISTNTYSLPSDLRVKSNIEAIGYGLEFLKALRPVQYNTTFQDQEKLSRKTFGLIAQEVEATLEQFGKSVEDVTFLEKFEPENETESRYGLGYQNLVPVLIKAIQEQQAIITDLKQRIETLENK